MNRMSWNVLLKTTLFVFPGGVLLAAMNSWRQWACIVEVIHASFSIIKLENKELGSVISVSQDRNVTQSRKI